MTPGRLRVMRILASSTCLHMSGHAAFCLCIRASLKNQAIFRHSLLQPSVLSCSKLYFSLDKIGSCYRSISYPPIDTFTMYLPMAKEAQKAILSYPQEQLLVHQEKCLPPQPCSALLK